MLAKQVIAVASSCELSAPKNSLTRPAGEMSLRMKQTCTRVHTRRKPGARAQTHTHTPARIELETVQRGSYSVKPGQEIDRHSGGNAGCADLRGPFSLIRKSERVHLQRKTKWTIITAF